MKQGWQHVVLLICLIAVLGLQISGCGDNGRTRNEEQRPMAKPAEQPAQPNDRGREDDELARLREELRRLREQQQAGTQAQPADNGGAGDNRLDDFKEDYKLQAQQRRALASSYVTQAQSYMAGGDLQKAFDLARQAVDLDPANKDAYDLYNELANALGKRPGGFNDQMNRREQEERAKRTAAKIEIERRWATGVNFYEEERYDKALEMFNSALELIKVQPYSTNVEDLADRLEGAIKLTEQKQREHELDLDLKRKRAAKHLEEVKAARAAESLQRRVNRIYKEAVRAFEAQEYEKAEKLANMILVELPNSGEARRLAEASREAYFSTRMNVSIDNRLREWRETILAMQEITIPWSDIIRYPQRPDWDKVTRRAWTLRQGGDAGEAGDIGPRLIQGLENVNIPRWTSRPEDSLYDVMSMLSDITSFNIIPHFSEDDAVDTTAPRLDLVDTNASDVLRLIMRLRNLEMTAENIDGEKPIIYITPAGSSVGEKVVEQYDVASLARRIRDFPGPDIMMTRDDEPFEIKTPDDDGAMSGDQVVEMIREYIAPETWNNDPDVFIKYQPGGQLLVKHTRKVQQQVNELLGNIRQSAGVLIHVETRFLTVRDDFLTDMGIDLDGNSTGSVGGSGGTGGSGGFGTGEEFNTNPVTHAIEGLLDRAVRAGSNIGADLGRTGGANFTLNFVDSVSFRMIVNAVEKSARGTSLSTTRITLFNSQRANIVVTRNNAVVPDYDVQVATGISIADPIPQVIRDGIFLDVRPTASPDLRYITLDLRPTLVSLQRPILTRRLKLSQDVTVDLHLPELEIQQVRTTAKVPDGGIVMLGGQSTMTESANRSTVPFVSEIPVLNFFFQRKGKTDFRSNTIILVKTKIVDLREEEFHQGVEGAVR